jgi:hypothetical protein
MFVSDKDEGRAFSACQTKKGYRMKGTVIAYPYVSARVSPRLTAKIRGKYNFGERIDIKRIEKGWGATAKGWVLMLWVLVGNEIVVPPTPPPASYHTKLPPFTTPAIGKFIRFKYDEELDMFDFKSRTAWMGYKHGALPATVPLNARPDFMPLSRAWQELWFECLVWQAGGTMTHDELLEAWKSITMHSRALTDQHSREQGYRDWILGVNMTGKDMEQRGLSMAGNIAEKLYGTTFKTLDLNQPVPLIEKIWGNNTLIWWATETDKPNWWDGGRVNVTGRWPQLGKLGTPFLNISFGGLNNTMKERIAPIDNLKSFSPYHP